MYCATILVGASCAASAADVFDAAGDADSVGKALSEATGVGVTVVASSSDELLAITATAKITIPTITANIILFDEPELVVVFLVDEYEEVAGFGVVEMVETEEREEPLTGTGGTLYVADFFAELFAVFLTALRADDFFAADFLTDFFVAFFTAFFAVFFGALRAVFFAATELLLY